MPTLTILAGSNGSGKSYFSEFFVRNGFISTLPINIDALEYKVDKKFIPDDTLRYGKELLKSIDKVFHMLCLEAIENKSDFAFECNLRTDQLKYVSEFEESGYIINLIYLWLDDIEISKKRVKIRVYEGGHNVGDENIKRNFEEGIKNLDISVSENNWNHVYIIDNSRDVKTKGEILLLLLEIEKDKIIQVSSNFLTDTRKRLLPNLSLFIQNQLTQTL